MPSVEALLRKHADGSVLTETSVVQRLWSDFGEIVRLTLSDGPHSTLILKHVKPPQTMAHPRGWTGQASDRRKRHSYEVEATWYEHHAQAANAHVRLPMPVAVQRDADELWILMEDLDVEFSRRRAALTPEEALPCLSWLAGFHAAHLGHAGEGLWPVGTYWHLGTREDEFRAMADGPIKQAAGWIDTTLRQATFQTLVHGDAKVANFCFAEANGTAETPVAAVDFQYVGRGPGVCDVAYFLGSCLSGSELSRSADRLLDHYFDVLDRRMCATDESLLQDRATRQALIDEWRHLYPIAWVDFHRFLLGWAPDHPKINDYTRRLAQALLG